MSWKRAIGIAAFLGLAALCWYGWDWYDQLAWLDALRPLRPWPQVLKVPVLVVLVALFLSMISWVWRKTGLGN